MPKQIKSLRFVAGIMPEADEEIVCVVEKVFTNADEKLCSNYSLAIVCDEHETNTLTAALLAAIELSATLRMLTDEEKLCQKDAKHTH